MKAARIPIAVGLSLPQDRLERRVAYEAVVAWAAANLRVVTSKEIVEQAGAARR